MKFFLAGIIQGSITEDRIHPQNYRERIKDILHRNFPQDEVYCPIEHHPQSLGYDEALGRRVFIKHIEMASEFDCLVAFLPEASMGTAIEMWVASCNARKIVSISPMAENWTIKFLSDAIVPGIAEFEEFVTSGRMKLLLDGKDSQG
ncbi:MAG TPA: hypothetical protein PL033_08500 [Candidatus Brocadiia bacterium]|nr:hypothetical protein [Candidatus Brocadiia bacterium]